MQEVRRRNNVLKYLWILSLLDETKVQVQPRTFSDQDRSCQGPVAEVFGRTLDVNCLTHIFLLLSIICDFQNL